MVNRRRVLASSASLAAAGVAGCLGGESDPADDSGSSGPNDENGDSGGQSYEVCLEPGGCHTFDAVPESFFVIPGSQEDMAMSLGLQPEAHAYPHRKPYKFYDQLPGVDIDLDDTLQYGEGESARNYDKEIFYEVDPDVILADPRMLQNYSSWSDADMKEIEQNVAPYLGSYIRFDYEGEQPYYTLYELFEKVTEIFQRQDQYEAWIDLRDDFMAEIEANLPPEDERPTAAVFWRGIDADAGLFQPAPISEKRNDVRSFRDLGIEDAFADRDIEGDVGYETLLEIDPDYLAALNLSSMTGEEWHSQVVEPLEDHSTARTLSAVQDGNVVRASGQFMGPVTHLFSTEALAKQVYPDRFGEWPGDSADIPEDEQLFDRERMADIVDGNL
ncbi:ABC transporter substrate-binding protein [Natronobacterium gregoryi]|uniref:ABC transporter substrate-binding protein n=2 Tax=Natronobacterium gregoryi TaxID=44930 RepID=L0AK75_NATGS|nr:ABC transporter substrate-binding protein [Natronobacterium gregoryi]AFZ73460.1 ABC-type Fe3+-hydroxamate transport system, periplasmic component [Natronobacterium gregoryi SP2]ELY68658.1 ferrichrome-binding protein [Natronobacterium gregoryi SP2]PLK20469.1 ABC transporter substrate-binding protein [Natronobacterium gregoryi SP2]SFI71432.1 ferrichrome-binding protein [Natronobacterium gregoryi]